MAKVKLSVVVAPEEEFFRFGLILRRFWWASDDLDRRFIHGYAGGERTC